MEIFNLFTGETDIGPEGDEPPGYLCTAARLGPKLGASRLGMSVYDLPPGEAICPYHFEWTDEEWLDRRRRAADAAHAGRRARPRAGRRRLLPGRPGGRASRAQRDRRRRRGSRLASTKNEFGIAEYPDSDKVGVWAGETHYMLRRSDHLEYWDGER